MKTRIEKPPAGSSFSDARRYRFELADGRIYALGVTGAQRRDPVGRDEIAGHLRAIRADLRLLESQAATKH